MNAADLEREVVELCQRLIRIDTSNPPGAETPAAELLAGYLGAAGLACEFAGPDRERLNLIARLPGRGDGPIRDDCLRLRAGLRHRPRCLPGRDPRRR